VYQPCRDLLTRLRDPTIDGVTAEKEVVQKLKVVVAMSSSDAEIMSCCML